LHRWWRQQLMLFEAASTAAPCQHSVQYCRASKVTSSVSVLPSLAQASGGWAGRCCLCRTHCVKLC
jgi:hypothetical protein